jgi:hypothetical protein
MMSRLVISGMVHVTVMVREYEGMMALFVPIERGMT